MQQLKIYIAGPMSGISNDNREVFNQKAAMIRAANTLHMLPGWQNSDGAKAEYHCAVKLGLPITFEQNELHEEVTY